MANIKGNGVPTKNTKGSVGDIYTDTKTGQKYKCVFAYLYEPDDRYDTEWKKMNPNQFLAGTTNNESPMPVNITEPNTVVDDSTMTEKPKRPPYASYHKGRQKTDSNAN